MPAAVPGMATSTATLQAAAHLRMAALKGKVMPFVEEEDKEKLY